MTNLLSTIKETAKNIIKGDISMRYNKDSQTVISWADMVETGKKKLEHVPTLFGLRKAVEEVLADRSKAKAPEVKEEYVEELETEVVE